MKMLDIDNPHAMDLEVTRAAILEAAPEWLHVVHTGTPRTCHNCGLTLDDGQVCYDDIYEGAYLEIAARAGLLAGWDGVSGCWTQQAPQLVKIAARLKAEGFGAR